MSARGGPGLYVALRADRALLRGVEAYEVAHLLAPEDQPPQWSRRMKGWVVPARVGLDALGWAQEHHVLAVLTDERSVGDVPSGAAVGGAA
jgi:hypothetical protein